MIAKNTALELAKHGFKVFPLVPNTKRPIKDQSYLTASNDPQTVAKWFDDLPPIQGPQVSLLAYSINRDPSALNGDAYRPSIVTNTVRVIRQKGNSKMAKKRSFSPDITEENKFYNLPLTAQALYFHLGMIADDDGVVNRVHSLSNYLGTDINDIDILINQGYLLKISESKKIYVLTDWLANNTIRKDRYKPTMYSEELAKLRLHNKRYYLR